MNDKAPTGVMRAIADFLRRWFPKKKGGMDPVLLATVALLVCCGIIILFSASYAYGQTKFGDGYYYVKAQLRGLAVGVVAMFLLARMDYRRLAGKHARIIVMASAIFLMILCFVPGIGTVEGVNSARRWIRLPFTSFQPSEYAKFAVLVVEAAFLAGRKPGIMHRKPWPSLLISMGILAPVLLLLALQPNYSILMITTMSFAVMVFASGMRWRDALFLAILLGIPLVINMFGAEYRMNRISSFWDPFSEENVTHGSQLRDSLYALGSGGIWGMGLGKSRMKFDFLSYGESDFILSIIGEEFGLVGLVLLLALYMVLIARGLQIARRSATRFGMLLSTGIVALTGIQTFVHILVGTGLMPTTGVTLPFISHGSSSLMCFMAAMGILLSVSTDRAPALARAGKGKLEAGQQDAPVEEGYIH